MGRNAAVGHEGNPLHFWPIDNRSSQGLFLLVRSFMAMKEPLPLLVDEQVFNPLLSSNCSDRNNIARKGSTPKEEFCLHAEIQLRFQKSIHCCRMHDQGLCSPRKQWTGQ